MKFTTEDVALIRSRYLAGEGSTRIAKDFGVSFGAILKLLRINGVKTRPSNESKKIPELEFWQHVKGSADLNGCWEWQGTRNPNGYGMFASKKRAHRISWEITRGPIPRGMFVCHKCDNPPCVRPDHLFIGTQKENMQDMHSKGRRQGNGLDGEKHHQAKLKVADVIEIRKRVSSGESRASVAASYGVTPENVSCIALGKTWRSV